MSDQTRLHESPIPEPPEKPGLTIGISGPERRSMAHRLINLALRLHGANTHYISPGSHTDVSLLDGLVLSGGTHVHPELYGQQPRVTARYDRKRDTTDHRLLLQAETINIPVLGICRGAQFINVFHGGTLCQNVRSEEHTSELQSRPHLVCRLLLEKKKK